MFSMQMSGVDREGEEITGGRDLYGDRCDTGSFREGVFQLVFEG